MSFEYLKHFFGETPVIVFEATPGYSAADGVRQKYTSKERDVETGLDYFGARYYASTLGRFTSVDPVVVRFSRLNDPQRWNLYGHDRETLIKGSNLSCKKLGFIKN